MNRHLWPTALILFLSATAACGDDGGSTADARLPTIDGAQSADAMASADATPCAEDLTPTDDGTGIAANLVISEIDPGDFIELYNNTDAPIALADLPHQLCSPFAYRALSASAPQVTIAPRGRAQIPWPSNFTTDNDAAGEIQLYRSANFSVSADIIDFVCWGPASTTRRKTQAEEEGVNKWAGDCAPTLPSSGSLERIMSTTGTAADSYRAVATPTPVNCE